MEVLGRPPDRVYLTILRFAFLRILCGYSRKFRETLMMKMHIWNIQKTQISWSGSIATIIYYIKSIKYSSVTQCFDFYKFVIRQAHF